MGFLLPLKKYASGIAKRVYWLLPALLSDPFDIAERWFDMTYTAPPYLVWILVSVGLAIASFLTYRELYVESTKANTSTVTLGRRGRLSFAHKMSLTDIGMQMEQIHGHSDPSGLEADMLDGILGGDLIKKTCHRCGKPRNQLGDDVI